MPQHETYMHEAMALAERGLGSVEPNPMVGAVMVRGDRVIGRGWTQPYGGAHAEVQALAEARAAGEDPAGATMVVTLEPCSHHGKTPPCVDALIDAGLAAVVVGIEDPFEQVAGRGIAKLRQAGVHVTVGVLAVEVRRQLAAYLKLQTKRIPWVICKWAQTLDGRIATRTGDSQWISGTASRRRVHELRGRCDGVAVGAGTVLADDPLLTNRSGAGRRPTRVIVDDRLQTPPDGRLVRSIPTAPVLIATTQDALAAGADRAGRLTDAGAEVLGLPAGEGGVDLNALLDALGRRRWTRLLVEGGARLLGQFLRAGLVDELQVFLAPRLLGGREGVPCVVWEEVDLISQAMPLPAPTVEAIDADLLLTYRLGE